MVGGTTHADNVGVVGGVESVADIAENVAESVVQWHQGLMLTCRRYSNVQVFGNLNKYRPSPDKLSDHGGYCHRSNRYQLCYYA